ncbi:MAG: DUF4383 domain-containing protein [Actinomycetota bacterium]|nr:DUF4383 domain-containing protein [Actinomycetota bacterium]
MSGSSPARLYATLVGGVLVVLGIVGFFYSASFETHERLTSEPVLGVIDVNGWHNLVHIVTGLLGLAAAGYAARTYALALGLIYLLLAIWGFTQTTDGAGDLLSLIPINTGDNVFHLVLGLTGLAAGAATPTAVAPRSARR